LPQTGRGKPAPALAPTGQPGQPLLEVRNLRTHFDTERGLFKAVDGISFRVDKGRTVGLVGESGCGKSVTSLSIMGLVPSPPGKVEADAVLFEGRDILALPKAERRGLRGSAMSMIFQEPMTSLNPVHTVGDQIVEAILLHAREWRPEGPRVTRREARGRTVDLFRDVGIAMAEERIDAYSWQLSGGLRERAMIAMALSCRPRLLIADEPTTAIDVTTQAQILNLLRDLQRKYRTAIVFITHDLGVIAQMAHHVVVMYLGRVAEQGPVDRIFHTPKHPYTRALLRSIPSLAAAPRVALPTIQGSIPHPFARPTGCPFHPRCPEVLPEVCVERVPSLQPVGLDQRASCFLYHDVDDRP
jgi:oligopeptide/dipeptide ABC transporter ATP-binding protein